jgi:hypothetical protein
MTTSSLDTREMKTEPIAEEAPPSGPPTWLIVASASALVILAAIMVFWPRATLLDRLRALDGGICAQLPTHSFYPGGQRLPLCVRNTGIYLGYTISFLILFLTRRGRAAQFPRWPMALVEEQRSSLPRSAHRRSVSTKLARHQACPMGKGHVFRSGEGETTTKAC